MEDDAPVETADQSTETPSDAGTPAESETPSVDAQAGAEGGDDPAGGETVEPLTQYLQSKGIKSLDDPAARTALHDLLRKRDNDNGSLAKRLKDLEAQLAQRVAPAKPAEPEPEPEPHPDIKSIDEYISTLKAELDEVPTAEATLVRDLWTLDRKIAIAEHDVAKADDLDKAAANAEVARLKAEHRLVQRHLDSLPRDRKRLEFQIQSAERQKSEAQRAIEAEESARQQAGEQQEKWESGFVAEVNTLIPRYADEFKLPADAGLRSEMAEDVTNALTVELWKRAEANIKDVNVQELLRGCVEKWAKKHGLVQAAKLAHLSKSKTPVAGKPNGTPQRTAPPPNTTTPQLSIHDRLAKEEDERVRKLERLMAG